MLFEQHPEIYWAVATAVFTAILWIPHILQRIIEMKPYAAFRDPFHDVATKAPWAKRAIRAHTNGVENLAAFGIFAFALDITSANSELTASAAAAYFFIRIAHYIIYVLGIPWARTPTFILGLISQMIMAAALFGMV